MGFELVIAITIASLSLIGTVLTAALSFRNKSNSVLFGASESIRRDIMDSNKNLKIRMDDMENTIQGFRDRFNNINEMLSYVAIRVDLLIKSVNKSISDHEGEETLHVDNLFDMKNILEQIEEKIADFKNEDKTGS